MSPERAIRWSTVGAVALVAAVAGWVSYDRALAVVRAHGETGTVAWLYPGTIDGLVYADSMVLLDAARRGADAPPLARWLLAGGIAATLAANVLAGLAYGWLSALVAAWPAAALVGSYELLIVVVRAGAEAPRGASRTSCARCGAGCQRALRATLAAGNLLSGRQLAERFRLNRTQVAQVRQAVLAEVNGHSPGGNQS